MSEMNTIREQAAEWLIYLDAGGPGDLNRNPGFREWLEQDPRHPRVFQQMQQLWSGASPAPSPSRLGRAFGTVGVCLLLAVCGVQLPWQTWRADYRSDVGEVVSYQLADGSRLTLNTNSAVNVDFEQGRRHIELIRGEVLADVESDPERPFVVATSNVSAEALGTLYSVQHHDDHSRVTVYESRVRVTRPGTNESLQLSAGQWARVGADIQSGTGTLPATPDWSRHQLIFNGASLKSVVERLGHYHSGVLMLSDALASGSRRFTGALPTDDSEAALALLAASLKIDIGGLPPYVVYLDEAP